MEAALLLPAIVRGAVRQPIKQPFEGRGQPCLKLDTGLRPVGAFSKIPSMPEVFAAADIGSNTVHLLVAKHSPVGMQRLVNESEWMSLGQIVSHTGKIPSSLVDKLASTLKTFKALAASQRASGIYVFATEAVRRAENYAEVVRKINRAAGVKIDIITPDREAELGLKGALLDCPQKKPFLLAETGGGSVQLALCNGVDILAEISLPIGTGVLMDKANLTSPAKVQNVKQAQKIIASCFQNLQGFESAVALVGSGGVVRGLWRALHPDGDRTVRLPEVEYLLWSTRNLDVETISKRFGVKAKRAETLLPGALVYQTIMSHFHIDRMEVSQFGVREGAVLEMSQGRIVPCPL